MRMKGFSAVGLNEVLSAASVPKGSFYHYFPSKEIFGEALLQRHFKHYLAEIDALLALPNQSGAGLLKRYFKGWGPGQADYDPASYCLVVKLAAEVADLSEAMRHALLVGTNEIIKRLAMMVERGLSDGSIATGESPVKLAERLYQLWLGASLLGKVTRNDKPFKAAMASMRQMLRAAVPAA